MLKVKISAGTRMVWVADEAHAEDGWIACERSPEAEIHARAANVLTRLRNATRAVKDARFA